MPPQCLGHRGCKQRSALQHHGQAIDGLAGFRVDGLVNQGMDQIGVTVEIVQPGHGQPQCVGDEIVLAAGAQEPEHYRVVGRGQAGVEHAAGKVGGLGGERHVVHVFQTLLVNGKARVFGAGRCGGKEGLHQPRGIGIASGFDVGVVKALGDLPDHFPNTVDLHRPLVQQSPDFRHQAVQ